jgi:hypothetical protein
MCLRPKAPLLQLRCMQGWVPQTCHVVSAHSPMAYRAPLAINAVPPKVVDASVTFALPVPQTAAAAPCSDYPEDRCGARDEEDPPESFIEPETPPSPPALCKEDGQTSGPPVGLMPLGPDWLGEPAGPVDSSPAPQAQPNSSQLVCLANSSCLPACGRQPRSSGSPLTQEVPIGPGGPTNPAPSAGTTTTIGASVPLQVYIPVGVMGISLCTWSLWGWFFLNILDCF